MHYVKLITETRFATVLKGIQEIHLEIAVSISYLGVITIVASYHLIGITHLMKINGNGSLEIIPCQKSSLYRKLIKYLYEITYILI